MLMQKKPVGISQGRNVLIDALYYQNDFMNYVEHVAGKRDRAVEGIRKIPNNNAKVPDGRPESMLDMRIWQLRRCMPLGMRYSTLYQRKENGFGKPGMDEYELVFEGRLEKSDLESMEERMARCTPNDFGGHQLSVSDIVELSQEGESRFFYAEAEGFEEIDLSQKGEKNAKE